MDRTSPHVRKTRRTQLVNYRAPSAPCTIVIDTAQTILYYFLGDGLRSATSSCMANGFIWAARRRDAIVSMAGLDASPRYARASAYCSAGAWRPVHPLGSRAIYLGTVYRIHCTTCIDDRHKFDRCFACSTPSD